MKITINEQEVEAKEGEYIIDVAKRAGIDVPHLCYNERLHRIGACRLCVVEVKGMPKLQAACATLVKDGMVILTHSARVLDARTYSRPL